MNTIATLAINIVGNIKGLTDALDGAQGALERASSSMRKAGTTLTAGVTLPLVGVGAMAFKSAADFEQSLNVMAQVSGATEEQMASLQAQALQLGAETSFSAGEAAAAMLELAKAGLDAEQVGQSIGGVLNLAAAGNLELAQAAEIAANAVNAFGLEASDSNSVANLLAATANASSVEVTDLAYSMQMASAVFASNSQSVETLNTALGILGNNGLKGSDAGTSLKTMMMSLAAPTDKAAATMQSLGVSIYDAEGNMRQLPAIMADLQAALYGTSTVTLTTSNRTAEQTERMEYLGGVIERTQRKLADYQSGLAGVAQSESDKVVAVDRLNRELAAAQAEYAGLAGIQDSVSTVTREMTEETRNQALATIFGSDAIRAANILLKEGETGWNDMAAALGNETAAADVANARMKGLGGAMEYLKGSIESVMIGAALPFTETLADMIRRGADLISRISELSPEMQRWGAIVGVAAAAAGPLLIAISYMASGLAALLSPVGLVVAAVAALGVAWATNFLGIRDLTAQAWDYIQPALSQLWAWLGTTLPVALATLQAWFSTAWNAITAALSAAWSTLQPILAAALESFQNALPGALLAMQTGFSTAWEVAGTAVTTAWGLMQPGITAIQEAFANLPTSLTTVQSSFSTVTTALQTAWETLSALLEPGIGRVRDAFGTLSESLGGLGPAFSEMGTALSGLWEAAQPVLDALGALIAAVFGIASVTLVNGFAASIEAIGPIVETVVDQITVFINTLSGVLAGATALVRAVIDGDWSAAWEAGESIVETFKDAIDDTLENLLEIAGTIFSGLFDVVVNTLEDLGLDVDTKMSQLLSLWESIWTALGEAVQPVIDAVESVKGAIETFVGWITSVRIPNPFEGWSFPSIPEWMGGGGGNQLGTSYWKGGLTMVGEDGPEPVWLPRGAQIMNHNDFRRALLDGAGGGPQVQVGPVYVQTDLDAYQIGMMARDALRRGY